jgi:hypothetical protein
LRRDIDALGSEFEDTGWEHDPDRSWTFSTRTESRLRRRGEGRQIYEKQATIE